MIKKQVIKDIKNLLDNGHTLNVYLQKNKNKSVKLWRYCNYIILRFSNNNNMKDLTRLLEDIIGAKGQAIDFEIVRKICTLSITISNSDTFIDGIESDLQDCQYIQNVELIERIDNKYKVQIEIDSNIGLTQLCSYIENEWGVDVELIKVAESY